MSVKNALGGALLFIGLALAIAGFAFGSSETITQTINGQEVVLKNSNAENLNWRVFMGGAVASLGVGLLIFPGQRIIDAGKFD